MQIAVKADEVPSAVRLGGKSGLEIDEDGFAVIDASQLIRAIEKAPKGRGKQKTFYALGKAGERKGSPVAKFFSVSVENIEHENIASYVNYFKKIAARLQRDLVLHARPEAVEPPRKDGRNLHVFPFAAPGYTSQILSDVFDGEPTDSQLSVDFLQPAFLGEVFGDRDGLALAEWHDNNLYVLWDFCLFPFSEPAEKMLDRIFNGTLSKLDKPDLFDEAAVRQSLKTVMESDTRNYKQERDNQIAAARQYEANHRRAWAEVVRLNQLLNGSEDAVAKRVDAAVHDLRAVHSLNGVCNAEFKDGVLEVTTYPVIIQDRDLGGFKIKITTDQITFHSLKGNSRSHPHLGSCGAPCFGNVGPQINKLLVEKEYLALVTFLIEYIHSYNSGDAYRQLEECGTKYTGSGETLGVIEDAIDPSQEILLGDILEALDEDG